MRSQNVIEAETQKKTVCHRVGLTMKYILLVLEATVTLYKGFIEPPKAARRHVTKHSTNTNN